MKEPLKLYKFRNTPTLKQTTWFGSIYKWVINGLIHGEVKKINDHTLEINHFTYKYKVRFGLPIREDIGDLIVDIINIKRDKINDGAVILNAATQCKFLDDAVLQEGEYEHKGFKITIVNISKDPDNVFLKYMVDARPHGRQFETQDADEMLVYLGAFELIRRSHMHPMPDPRWLDVRI